MEDRSRQRLEATADSITKVGRYVLSQILILMGRKNLWTIRVELQAKLGADVESVDRHSVEGDLSRKRVVKTFNNWMLQSTVTNWNMLI